MSNTKIYLLKHLIPSESKTMVISSDVVAVKEEPEYFEEPEHRSYNNPVDSETSIVLPEGFYEGYEDTNETASVVFTTYSNLHCVLNEVSWPEW